MTNSPNTIKDSVLQKIADDRLTPTSKWYFRAQHAALWIPGILVTVLGSFAVAGMVFSFTHAGWQYRSYTDQGFIEFFSQVVPLLWISSFALFGAIIVKTLRLTARGYRYTTSMLLLASFLLSVFFGLGLLALDRLTPHGARIVRFQAERAQKLIWSDPARGRIAGVLDIDSNGVLLTDTTGHVWHLITTELVDTELLNDERSVRILGEQLDANTFIVCMLLPWNLSPVPHMLNTPSVRPLPPLVPLGRCTKFTPPQSSSERNSIP